MKNFKDILEKFYIENEKYEKFPEGIYVLRIVKNSYAKNKKPNRIFKNIKNFRRDPFIYIFF